MRRHCEKSGLTFAGNVFTVLQPSKPRGHGIQATVAARFHHLAGNIVFQQCRKSFREGQQRCQVNARGPPYLIEHMHDVFRADVAPSRLERTASGAQGTVRKTSTYSHDYESRWHRGARP
jgi:hypothetical protein